MYVQPHSGGMYDLSLPRGTKVTFAIGSDCDKVSVVTITVGPSGGGSAVVEWLVPYR